MSKVAEVSDHAIDEGVKEWFEVNQVSSLVGNVLARSELDHLSIALLPRTASLA
jgi:hypothetical protein